VTHDAIHQAFAEPFAPMLREHEQITPGAQVGGFEVGEPTILVGGEFPEISDGWTSVTRAAGS